MCKLGAIEQALVVLVFFNLMVVIFVVLPADCTGWAFVQRMSSAWAWVCGLTSKQATNQARTRRCTHAHVHAGQRYLCGECRKCGV